MLLHQLIKSPVDALIRNAQADAYWQAGDRILPPVESFTAKTIKETRKARALSQAEFAKLLGVSTDMVKSLETGRRLPSDELTKSLNDLRLLPTMDDLFKVCLREWFEFFQPLIPELESFRFADFWVFALERIQQPEAAWVTTYRN